MMPRKIYLAFCDFFYYLNENLLLTFKYYVNNNAENCHFKYK